MKNWHRYAWWVEKTQQCAQRTHFYPYTLQSHRNTSMPMKYPLLFHKRMNRVFTYAETGVEPHAGPVRSQVLWACTAGMNRDTRQVWHIPGQLASAATSSILSTITRYNFIYQKKRPFLRHIINVFWVRCQEEGWKKAALYLFILTEQGKTVCC